MNKPPVTDYLDYRRFLKDWFAFKKSRFNSFSHRKLAAALQLASPAFIVQVFKGKKNLSQKLVLKLGKFLELTDRDFQYFDLLVHFNQARGMDEKNHYFKQLAKFRGSRAKVVHESQYKFYTKWYYCVVWNYFGINQKERRPVEVARQVFPPITPKEAKDAIQLLLDLQLIVKTANGYAVSENHLVTENPFRGMVAREYNEIFVEMAAKALSTVPADSRQYNLLTFSISENGFRTIKDRIRSFQEELRDIIERDKIEDRIYTLCMQLYPNSRNH